MKSKIAAFLFAIVLGSCAVAPAHANERSATCASLAPNVVEMDGAISEFGNSLANIEYTQVAQILNPTDSSVANEMENRRLALLEEVAAFISANESLYHALARCASVNR